MLSNTRDISTPGRRIYEVIFFISSFSWVLFSFFIPFLLF